jgi:spoIIIJ-associated protein
MDDGMADLRTSIEIIAPTIEEAVARGAAELGVEPETLDVQVLDEGGKGLFGLGLRQARVRLTLRDQATSPRPAPSRPEARSTSRPKARPVPRPEARPATSGDEEADEPLRVAEEILRELLERMGVDAAVQARWGEAADEDAHRPVLVDLHGDDLSILIGHRGETLAALQYITRLIAGKELQQPAPILIDVEGYRARRESQLRQLARRMAEQAVERGRTMSLEPMPANERRIIHIELRDHANVTTESIGEGDHRKVTIIPRP